LDKKTEELAYLAVLGTLRLESVCHFTLRWPSKRELRAKKSSARFWSDCPLPIRASRKLCPERYRPTAPSRNFVPVEVFAQGAFGNRSLAKMLGGWSSKAKG
jgi:hypothetical protein